MGLFRRNKQEKDRIREVLGEAQRYKDLAQEVSDKTGRELGIDMATIMREGNRAMAGGGQQQMLAYSARIARVVQAGVEMPATVRSVEFGQPSPLQGGIPAQLELTVEAPDGAPYDVSTDQILHESMASTLAADQRITVKVDPDDRDNVLVWATTDAPAAESAPAAGADRSERLAKLEELRTSGVLTDEEFEAQKSKLLGE